MFSLEKFLEFFKDSKILIPVLIAVIIVGALGGGLWIHTLDEKIDLYKSTVDLDKSRIDLDKSLGNEKIEAVKNETEYHIKKVKEKIADLKDDVDRVIKQSKYNNDSTMSYIKKLKEYIISHNLKDSSKGLFYISEMQKDRDNLVNNAIRVDSVLSNKDKTFALVMQSSSNVKVGNLDEEVSARSNSTVSLVIQFVIILIVLFIVFQIGKIIYWFIKNRKQT